MTQVAFSPDGKTIAAAGSEHYIQLWNADTGEPLRRLDRHTDVIQDIVFGPHGERLYSGSVDKSVFAWNVATGQPVWIDTKGPRSIVQVEASLTGQLLATASCCATIQLRAAESGQIKNILAVDDLVELKFAPNGSRLFVLTRESLQLYDASNSGMLTSIPVRTVSDELLRGGGSRVSSLSVSPNGGLVAVGKGEQGVMVYSFNKD